MSFTYETKALTHHAALTLLSAAVAKAEEIGQPQCIVVVDASGELLSEVRMNGSKFLSRKSARAKAQTAASINNVTQSIPADFRGPIGMATGNAVTGLPGGMPIRFGGVLVGAIGVGSGSGDQDIEVGTAALAAIGADSLS